MGELARDFFQAELVPHFERFDKQKYVDREVWLKAGAIGLLCCEVPAEFGGGGGTFAHDAMVFSEQARSGDTGFGNLVHSGVVAHYLSAYGSDEQRSRWLPGMASGELIGSVAMSEPGAGSDLKNIATRAVRAGDHYVISGSKTFISNGAQCDLVIVVAKTDPAAGRNGISLLVLETADAPGFRRGRVLDKLGMHAQDTAELFFDEVSVPVGNLLGEEGGGFGMMMRELPRERLVIGVTAVAAMERALQETIAYTKAREAFGAPLFSMQHVRLELAELATVVRASRVSSWTTASSGSSAARSIPRRRRWRNGGCPRTSAMSPIDACSCSAATATCGSTSSPACMPMRGRRRSTAGPTRS